MRVGVLEALITSVLRELISKLAPCLPAHVIFFPGGGLKYRNLAKGLRPIVAFVRASRKRFLFGTSSFNRFCVWLDFRKGDLVAQKYTIVN